ncbi:unnamed protein product [Discula destructiva]
MEQPFSTSKVTVDYFDPHDVYKLLEPGLIPRLPLRNLNWQSHAGPLRSIETLHVELVDALAAAKAPGRQRSVSAVSNAGLDDGFTTQALGGGLRGKLEDDSFPTKPYSPGYGPSAAYATRRHQIPGLRQTPYLKVLFVRCDDNDSYKSSVRAEVREWVKDHATQSPSTNTNKKDARNAAENHDAFEWLIVHIVVPNTAAATQPRTSATGKDGSVEAAAAKSSTTRWGKGSTTILEKMRADFNPSSKANADHVAQIRIGINDVPYDLLPRVVPAVPTGYSETEEDAKLAWAELIDKVKRLILSSFDLRVTQYEEDIKERDAMRNLPGWNFCTFFMLKEGLARGFESVGLIEDSLVGYDELSFGLDAIIHEQEAAGLSEAAGGSLLAYTEDLKKAAESAMTMATAGAMEFVDEESVDLQSKDANAAEGFDDIPISVFKKPYRELILANNVSKFDFKCYIFARQIALLLRQGNAMSTREELVTKLKEQQESVLKGVAPRAPPPKQIDESENLSFLAEICKRTLEFIPAVSQVMRRDVISALTDHKKQDSNEEKPRTPPPHDSLLTEVAENIVASFAFSIAQQILAQTFSEALPIPSATTGPAAADSSEPKAYVSEPKTIIHPARSASLRIGTAGNRLSTIPSPNFFPGPGNRKASLPDMKDAVDQQSRKTGMIELASRRAELYALSRSILEEAGKKRAWSNGWSSAPVIGETGLQEMENVSLDDEDDDLQTTVDTKSEEQSKDTKSTKFTLAGLDNNLLRTALDNKEDFYRLYEMLTDKALRHYTIAYHTHSVLANMSDLAVMKYHLRDYAAAASYFLRTTPFYGESGWSLLELSMLVMYSKCLRELKRHDEYVRVVLKLLSKAANSERDRIQSRRAIRLGGDVPKDHPEITAFKGFLPDFLDAAKSFDKEVKHSLQNFFTDIELEGTPVYDDGQDGFSLMLKLRSVLADELPVDKAMMRIVSAGGARELWLENTDAAKLKPGRNKLHLRCNSVGPGTYEVDRIQLHSGELKLNFERQAFQPVDRHAVNLRHPYVVLAQRADTLELKVEPATIVQLDRDNAMDLELSTGWNTVSRCDVRVRSATGGLRLLTAEAHIVGDGDQPQFHAIEAGLFGFSNLASGSAVRLRVPFTTEQDVASVSVKIEVKYTTENGTFTLMKTPSISLALKLGVNVQDVFKHAALYSRFTVSTSSSSPLRLFKSELADSEVFETKYGVPPGNPVIVFPKQPASLLYQIKRKAGVKIGPKTNKIMYLRLFYSVLQDEIADNIRDSMTASLKDTPMWPYSRLAVSAVLQHVRNDLTPYDLERAAVLGELPTGYLAEINWHNHFYGLGTLSDGEDAAASLTNFVVGWTRKNHLIATMRPIDAAEQLSILIPVDIPSMAVVHTADIRLERPIPSVVEPADSIEPPVACINQLLHATLHLKWTRVWDTDRIDGASTNSDGDEFSYEINAPGDTWLVGGRKKGHFVIPSPADAGTESSALSSSPATEAHIPLVLIPLREGWLPYPAVEVREVSHGGSDAGGGGDEAGTNTLMGHCETDYRNLGETVRVVADRARITVSLDASGPGGGPLVLESERVLVGDAARVARIVG